MQQNSLFNSSPFRAIQKRFYEPKPEHVHTKGQYALWKWTRSPSAMAGYPVLIPLVWSLVISGYIGYRTLTNHVDVYFDKKKQALGWDMSVPPKEKTYALAPRDESFRFRGASRLPDSEIEL